MISGANAGKGRITLEYIKDYPLVLQKLSIDNKQPGIRTVADQLLSAAIIRDLVVAFPDAIDTSTLNLNGESVAIAYHPDNLNCIQLECKTVKKYDVTYKKYSQFSIFIDDVTKNNTPTENQIISIHQENISETGICVLVLNINFQSRLIAMDYASVLKEALGRDHLPIYFYTPGETQHLSEYTSEQQQADMRFCNKPTVVKNLSRNNANYYTLLGMQSTDINLLMKCSDGRCLIESLLHSHKIELLESILLKSKIKISDTWKNLSSKLPVNKVLEMAIIKNCRNVFTQLLDYSPDINAINDNGMTLLHCGINQLWAVELLIEKGAKVDVYSVRKNDKAITATPFYMAANNGCSLNVVKYLHSKGAEINARAAMSEGRENGLIDNSTALTSALKNNHIILAEYLLNSGADIRIVYENRLIHFLAENGMLRQLELLNSYNVDINFRFGNKTPLYYAITNSHMDVVKYIVKKVNKRDDLIKQSLKEQERMFKYKESYQSCREVLLYLIGQGADVNVKIGEGDYLIHGVAKQGDTEVMKKLLENKVSINQVNKDNYTALAMAIDNQYHDLSQFLILNGADQRIMPDDDTLLSMAARSGDIEIFKSLILGIDINKQQEYLDAFYAAVRCGKFEILNLILESGLTIEQIRSQALELSKSLFIMIMNNHLETFKFLVNKRIIDINVPIQLDMNDVMYGPAYIFYGPVKEMMKESKLDKQDYPLFFTSSTKPKKMDKNIISFYALQLAAFWRHLDFFEYCLPFALPNQFSYAAHLVLLNKSDIRSDDLILIQILNQLEQFCTQSMGDAIVPFKDVQHPVFLAISTKQNESVLSHLTHSEYYSTSLADPDAGSMLYQLLKNNYSFDAISLMLKLEGELLLHYAARTNDAKSIKYLVDKGHNIQQTNTRGETAMHIAILHGSKQAINSFMDASFKNLDNLIFGYLSQDQKSCAYYFLETKQMDELVKIMGSGNWGIDVICHKAISNRDYNFLYLFIDSNIHDVEILTSAIHAVAMQTGEYRPELASFIIDYILDKPLSKDFIQTIGHEMLHNKIHLKYAHLLHEKEYDFHFPEGDNEWSVVDRILIGPSPELMDFLKVKLQVTLESELSNKRFLKCMNENQRKILIVELYKLLKDESRRDLLDESVNFELMFLHIEKIMNHFDYNESAYISADESYSGLDEDEYSSGSSDQSSDAVIETDSTSDDSSINEIVNNVNPKCW